MPESKRDKDGRDEMRLADRYQFEMKEERGHDKKKYEWRAWRAER